MRDAPARHGLCIPEQFFIEELDLLTGGFDVLSLFAASGATAF
jgi:hypothetical protein